MTVLRCASAVLLFAWLTQPATADPPPAPPAATPPPAVAKLPLTGLEPAKIVPNLCLLKYRVTTTSPTCQAFFDQGLGYFYSYVWMEAARAFETATRHDPDCALAWWGLSRAMEKWRPPDAKKPLLKANDLLAKASHREQQLILARMQEKGLAPGSKRENRNTTAIATIDNMLAIYDDDEEGWMYRAYLDGGSRLFGGVLSSVPFYKAVLRINPLHPGANHELLHYYESCQRPALGWVNAENFIQSSPGIPHPFHMQAHLATRLGRWDKTSDRSARAIELERAYHKEMNVKPDDDHQYGHHLEILTLSLIHDGRYTEARAIKEEVKRIGMQHRVHWVRLHVAERRWDDALKVADEMRKGEKVTASYLAALAYLKQGNVERAAPEVAVLQQEFHRHRNDRQLEFRLWETQGVLLCRMGAPEQGLKLLSRAVERSKNDYSHHSWGNGAYYMETWGIEALHVGKTDLAEEAFLEALAHDRGCARAALGMQVLCERQGRTEEAARYATLAQRCWHKADPNVLSAELASLREDKFTTNNTNNTNKKNSFSQVH